METLGQALRDGWAVEMRCQRPGRIGTSKSKPCRFTKRLDLETLVATRGPGFPTGKLQSRLMCPRCGHRDVLVLYHAARDAGAAHG